MMEGYWPTVLTDPDADAAALNHARWVDEATKVVVSTTLDSVTWRNTVLIKDNIAEQIKAMKQQSGKDMWLLGSPRLAQTFMQLGLIDEYRINVSPVILGSGMPLFGDTKLDLELLEAQTFKGGVVALRYGPKR
jgi:dihydrofolate reductase